MAFTPLPNSTSPTRIVITAETGTGSDQTAYTPPTGSRVRVLGGHISGGADSSGALVVKVGSTTIDAGGIAAQQTTINIASPFNLVDKPYDGAANEALKVNVTTGVPYVGCILVQVF